MRTVCRLPDPEVDIAVIDTNPHTPDIVQAAMDTSDIILIPTTASHLDLERTWLTLDVARQTQATVYVLITMAEPRALAYMQALLALEGNGAPSLTTSIKKATLIKAEATRRPVAYYGYDQVAHDMGLV